MGEETRELVRQGIVPVVLGNGRAAHRVSARLYRSFGLPSLVCGARRSLWDLFDPTCAFRALPYGGSDRLIAEELVTLAGEYEDCLLLLIPLTEEHWALIRAYDSLLGAYFVCRDPDDLWEEPLLDGIRMT